MILKAGLTKKGMCFKINKSFNVKYPAGVWNSLPAQSKEALKDNLAYLKIASFSAVMDEKFILNTPKPLLKRFIDESARRDFVRFAYEDKISPSRLISRFRKASFEFSKGTPKSFGDGYSARMKEGSLVSFSFGKDSLLSYALAKELGSPVKTVFFEDTWDVELQHKKRLMARFKKEFNEKTIIVYDDFDNIDSDPAFKKLKSEGVYGCNAMNGYLLMALPVAYNEKLPEIIFGNEQKLNNKFVDAEGNHGFVSFEQSSQGMALQNRMLNRFTGNMRVASLVEPLNDINETKLLFTRYPQYAKYIMSCVHPDDEPTNNRWCHECTDCARIFLLISAIGVSPKKAGFSKQLFTRYNADNFALFEKDIGVAYNMAKDERDEQLLAFYECYKRGIKAPLIDEFKKKFLAEAKEREEELRRKFMTIRKPTTLKGKRAASLISIFKETLA